MERGNQLKFNLVSPESLVFSKKVWMVTIPGEDGDMGVLAGHAPVLSSLRLGWLSIFEEEDINYNTDNRFLINKGFVRIESGLCTVMSEDILHISNISSSRLESDIKVLYSKLDNTDSEKERNLTKNKISLLNKKLSLLKEV